MSPKNANLSIWTTATRQITKTWRRAKILGLFTDYSSVLSHACCARQLSWACVWTPRDWALLISATPKPALSPGLLYQMDAPSPIATTACGNHGWATHQTQPKDQKLCTVIRVAFAVYCWLENSSFIMAKFYIPSLHSDDPKSLTGKSSRNLDWPVASY